MNRTGNYAQAVVQPATLNPYERKSNLSGTSLSTFKYSPPASLKPVNSKTKPENFTFKKLSDSTDLSSRNDAKLEYFGTSGTNLKTQQALIPTTSYSISPSFGVQNPNDLSYRKSLSNDTVFVKNLNSNIVQERQTEEDHVKTRQQTPQDSSEESVHEEQIEKD